MNRTREFVPLRADPTGRDAVDAKRTDLVVGGWRAQDDLYRARDRQIEENVRMLAGQQWYIYHPVLGVFIDPSAWMTERERRWRQRPVFNRLLNWFILTHARMTEGSPVLTFVPGPDRIDAELAEVLDVAFKQKWGEMGMVDAHDRIAAWAIAAGRAHSQLRLDLNGGDVREWIGTDLVPVVDEYDQPILGPDGEPLSQMAEGVPFGRDGQPLANWRAMGGDPTRGALNVLGSPYRERKGKIVCDVLSPLEVRGTWGPQSWHEKPVHLTRQYLTVEQVHETWGVEVPAAINPGGDATTGELQRIQFGSGFFSQLFNPAETMAQPQSTEGYVEVLTRWERPTMRPGMEETEEQPGGRYTVVVNVPQKDGGSRVVYDGPRPVKFAHTSPIRCFDFVRLPGRPSGTTPQEALNPLQRMWNRVHGQVAEHVNLSTNPKGIVDQATGLKANQMTNEPGEHLIVNRRPGVTPIEYVAPPPLSRDVYQHISSIGEEFLLLGNLAGTEGDNPFEESGEAIKERRFNSDRFLGPTLRRWVEEYARMGDDLRVLLGTVWDEEEWISYTGEDNIARTLLVRPLLFEQGRVHVRPDAESLLPESRGERQRRVYQLWKDGALGDPLLPATLNRFYEMMRFPHLSRVARPGGVDRATAEQFVGRLLQGEPAEALPAYEWYDFDVHLDVLEAVMKSPEFLKLDPNIQSAFVLRRQVLLTGREQKMVQQAMQQAMTGVPSRMGGTGGGNAPGGPGGGVPITTPPLPPERIATMSPSVAPPPPEAPRGTPAMPTALPSGTA